MKIYQQDFSVNLLPKFEWVLAAPHVQLSDLKNINDWHTNMPAHNSEVKQVLWGRVTLSFNALEREHAYLTIGNPALDLVDIYLLDNQERILNSYLFGAKRAFDKRQVRHRLFIAEVEDGYSNVHVYLKIQNDGPLVFPIYLEKQSIAINKEQNTLIIVGFLSGGLSILACYFFITYIFMRSPIRFWFSLFCAAFVLLYLNSTGVIGQLTGVTAYISNFSIALAGTVLLAALKVIFTILGNLPNLWRYSLYTLGGSLIGLAFLDLGTLQIKLVLMLLLTCILLLAILSSPYSEPDKKNANLLSLLGFTLVSCGVAGQLAVYFLINSFNQFSPLLLDTLIMLGILVIALAIETHEKVLAHRHNQQQLNAIDDLQHFYNLFTSAAEGLYTSSIDGKLMSVNPAMCTLFGYQDEQHMLANISNANEFYANPEDRDLFLGEIHQHGKVIGKEIKGIKSDNSEFWFSISGQIKIENNERYVFGSIFDITKRKQSDMSLEFMATHDSLTGVYNRREFERQLKQTMLMVREEQGDLALLYMDLDQFKIVNDTCGHKAGDMLISELTQKLDNLVADQGTFARLGGDEFGVLLKNDNAQVAYLLANKILNAVAEYRFIWEKNIFTLGISIGHASWHLDISSAEQLLSMADAACYISKKQGRNQIHTYSQQDDYEQKHQTELSWLSTINQAVQNNQFELFYQHFRALNKKVEGHHYEILIRMKNDTSEFIAPADFMPAAERYNLTAQIDRWVVETYFAWLHSHPEHLVELSQVNINLSGHSLADNELKLFILNAFEKYKIPYHKICFEMIESMAILKKEETLAFIGTFQKLGCKFALDDFGCGFSSYNYLKNISIQQLKIDGSFVKDILVDPVCLAMVNSIKDVAKAMEIETVAEFVESPEVMVELGKIGVDYAQGYGVVKPFSLKEFSPLR